MMESVVYLEAVSIKIKIKLNINLLACFVAVDPIFEDDILANLSINWCYGAIKFIIIGG